MDIQILGGVGVARDGRRHEIARRGARAVLARLAMAPGVPLSFDRLESELWTDRSDAKTRNAMHATVARLRKTLSAVDENSGALVRTLAHGYVLDVAPEAVDAQRFLRLAERGAALVDPCPDRAVTVLDEALRLWRGPALTDVGDAVAFRVEAAHLDERRLSAHEDLAAARVASGDAAAVLDDLRRFAAEHPERERFTEQLMVALYRCGRQAEAVEAFHRTRRTLDADLGLRPGRGLHRVYQSILDHDRVLG